MSTEVNIDGLERAVRDFALRKAEQLGDAFVDLVQSNMPRRTNVLADSVVAESPVESSSGFTVRAYVGADYARYVNDGTGIYGPEGTPIRPVTARVLAFDWPAAGGLVFAHSVRGSEPTHFWERSLDAWPRVVAEVS